MSASYLSFIKLETLRETGGPRPGGFENEHVTQFILIDQKLEDMIVK